MAKLDAGPTPDGDAKTGRAPRSANQRGAARLAAVQALYQMDVAGSGLMETIAEFEAFRLGREIDGDRFLKADPGYFRDIVSGVLRDQRELDRQIHNVLTRDWPLRRLDTTLRAILRAGAFELRNRADVPARVVITEYVDVARAFYDGEEPKIVNAVLDAIAHEQRAWEFD